jgi:putative sterol carrier protein
MAMPTNAQEVFDVLVPQGLSQFPDKARELNAIYAFKITGDGGGDWTVDCTSNPPTCSKGASDKAQCTIEVSNEDFKTMLGDPNAGMQLFFANKLRISGDVTLAMKLQQLFELARPKA